MPPLRQHRHAEKFHSVRCPICGEYLFLEKAGDELLWSEHRLGLLFQKGGWQFLGISSPPSWFIENII
jgi:hypothetical protein